MHFFGMIDLMKQRKHRRPGVRKSGPAQRKLGTLQPGDRIADKFHKTDVEALIRDVALGAPLAIVCGSVGITPRTFENWLDSHPEFAEKLCTEKRKVIVETLNAIRACGSKESEFRHLAWFLERVYPDAFAPKPPTVALGVQQNFTITIEQARQIEDMRANLLPRVNERFAALTNGEGINGTGTEATS